MLTLGVVLDCELCTMVFMVKTVIQIKFNRFANFQYISLMLWVAASH